MFSVSWVRLGFSLVAPAPEAGRNDEEGNGPPAPGARRPHRRHPYRRRAGWHRASLICGPHPLRERAVPLSKVRKPSKGNGRLAPWPCLPWLLRRSFAGVALRAPGVSPVPAVVGFPASPGYQQPGQTRARSPRLIGFNGWLCFSVFFLLPGWYRAG